MAILNAGEEDELICYSYRTSRAKHLLSYLVSAIFIGIPHLIWHWRPAWKVYLFGNECKSSLADNVILVCTKTNEASVSQVKRSPVPKPFPKKFTVYQTSTPCEESTITTPVVPMQWYQHFMHKNVKYVMVASTGVFEPLHGLFNVEVRSMLIGYQGLSPEEQHAGQVLHGKNSIEVEIQSYWKLFYEEVLNPFYVLQIFSMILWSIDEYVLYASCILVLSSGSLTLTLLETRRQSEALHDMVASSNCQVVTVCRGQGQFEEVASDTLVPGDLISIKVNTTMACDVVLVSGSCVVNEAMLTGESLPVNKTAPFNQEFAHSNDTIDLEQHKQHCIFGGTSVIQTRKKKGEDYVLAVVVKTGFSTCKGELIRSILYPKPLGFKFYKDLMRFVFILFGIAIMGMVYSVFVFAQRGSSVPIILVRCLDLITIVIPSALPAAMTVGIYYSQTRLKRNLIFCTSPQRINVGGKVNVVCFDKTGTLTENGLDIMGIMPAKDAKFKRLNRKITSLTSDDPLLTCLACCHSLVLINNKLTGDPLEVKMFGATGWSIDKMDETGDQDEMAISHTNLFSQHGPSTQVNVIKEFPFNSSLSRMSVIVQSTEDKLFNAVFTKGSPDKLYSMLSAESVPSNYRSQLQNFTEKGFRVLSLAFKKLPEDMERQEMLALKRTVVERDLIFLGFLVLQNALKPETMPVIKQLKKADTRTLMLTGDDVMTAISVARECQIIDAGKKVVSVSTNSSSEGVQALSFSEVIQSAMSSSEDESIKMESSLNQLTIDIDTINNNPNIHFALSGSSWNYVQKHFPDFKSKLLQFDTVFGRMTPENKVQVVQELQNNGNIVAMCGDGANDCGALKSANVGISLSEAEASVAAPFTSHTSNITCVPTLISEGRCALVTSTSIFKYMGLYSLTQFISVLLMYWTMTNMGDTQFLYTDISITATVTLLMSWTGPYEKLAKKCPTASLMSASVIFSLLSQAALVLAFQAAVFVYLGSLDWFIPNSIDNNGLFVMSQENTAIFNISSFQYLILAFAVSRGPPYRKPLYTNVPFLLALVILTSFSLVLTLYPGHFLANFFQIVFEPNDLHLSYRIVLLCMALAHLLMALLLEGVAESSLLKRLLAKKKPATLDVDMQRIVWAASMQSG